MTRADQTEIRMRIVIDEPVIGVAHSLQSKEGRPLDARCSNEGDPLAFDFAIRVAPGPRFFGDQVRREGPERRIVHVRIGQMAGDPASPWTRRMKIDIHDIATEMLDLAARGGIIETRVHGTARDGTPACATLKPTSRLIVQPLAGSKGRMLALGIGGGRQAACDRPR